VHSAHTYYLVRAHPLGSNKIKCGVHCPPSVFFFIGKFSLKLRPEKCDFDQYKAFFFHGKKWCPNFPNFKKEKNQIKLPYFYNKFQSVAKNIYIRIRVAVWPSFGQCHKILGSNQCCRAVLDICEELMGSGSKK
jgi:hypothetical protein